MLTSCPECKTTFRLTQEQLSQRRGLVRCGRCKAVFNAYHTLLPDLVEPPTPPETDLSPESPETTALPVMRLPELELAMTLPALDATGSQPLDPMRPEPPDLPPVQAIDKSMPAVTPPATQDILLSELPTRPGPDTGGGWKVPLYAVLSLLLLALLMLQGAYFLRADLAAAVPELRPLLQEMCAQLDCTVPLPHQLDKRAIVASSLEHDAERASHVRLTLLLANRSGTVQAWPHLLLTLLDLHEAPVAIKTFPPSVYLPAGLREETGMTAGHEVEVRLELELGKLEAAGYTVELLYPQ